MADDKLSDRPSFTDTADKANDLLYYVDDSESGIAKSKKVTVGKLESELAVSGHGDFDANRWIDHSAVSITAAASGGLAGGGAITGSSTFSIDHTNTPEKASLGTADEFLIFDANDSDAIKRIDSSFVTFDISSLQDKAASAVDFDNDLIAQYSVATSGNFKLAMNVYDLRYVEKDFSQYSDATPASGDFIVINDTDDSGNTKRVSASAFLNSLVDTSQAATGYEFQQLSAGMWTPDETEGPELEQIELGNNSASIDVLSFDASSIERAAFLLDMPDNWDASGLKFKVKWTQSTAATGDVHWGFRATPFGDNESITGSFQTAATGADTSHNTVHDMHISSAIGDVACTGWSLGESVLLEVFRDATSDTFGEDAQLISVQMQIAVSGTVAGW